jgi:hypothetical protein
MRQRYLLHHFPTLLGDLPRTTVRLSKSLRPGVQRCILEILLSIPFVGLFIAVVIYHWEYGFFMALAVAPAAIVLSSSSLVLLIVVQQHREQRQNPANATTIRRNQDS